LVLPHGQSNTEKVLALERRKPSFENAGLRNCVSNASNVSNANGWVTRTRSES
jgi:hypothetical protein